MNKTELVAATASKMSISKKEVEEVLTNILDTMTETLQEGEEVNIAGFGKFDIRTRAAREGRNPQTGEALQIAESKTVGWKPAKKLKESVK